MVATYGRSSGNQVYDSESNVQRNASNPTPTVSRKTSEINGALERESSVNKRALTGRVGRESVSTVRRKPSAPTQASRRGSLPWLDGKPTSTKGHTRPKNYMPGGFDVESASSTASTETPPSPATQPRKSKPFLLADLSVRPIGSMPSLRETASQRSLTRKASSAGSSGGTLPPISAAPSKAAVVQATPVKKATDSVRYSASEYSTTPPSTRSTKSVAPGVKRPYSYEEFVRKPEELDDITEKLRDEPKQPNNQIQQPVPTVATTIVDASGRKSSNVPVITLPHDSTRYRLPFVPESQPPLTVNMMRTSTMRVSPFSLTPGKKPSFTAPDPEGGLRRAITGLEGLMQEAISVAKDAAEHKKPEEVSEILEEAAIALRRASTTGLQNRARLQQLEPLPVSDSELDSSGDSSYFSESGSSVDGGHLSHETSRTVLTAGTHPSQVFVSAPYAKNGRPVESDQAEIVNSIPGTPPRFYNPPSVESITRDFAYPTPKNGGLRRRSRSSASVSSVDANATLRRVKTGLGTQHVNFPIEPAATLSPRREQVDHVLRPVGSQQAVNEHIEQHPRSSSLNRDEPEVLQVPRRRRRKPERDFAHAQGASTTELDYGQEPYRHDSKFAGEKPHRKDRDPNGVSLKRKHHFSLRGQDGFSLSRHHRHQPVARNWRTSRKRITATIACVNTALLGYIIGVYAGEVPRIQYQLGDQDHYILQGNVYLYIGLAISTFTFWPLPLLHGRKPYTLAALAIALPLQFPQATIVSQPRSPSDARYSTGLLMSRFFTGLSLGFANINTLTTLFDLFGASLQSTNPHQELVVVNDVRRHGGGMGIWLGIWTWCFIASLALGFLTGAGIIADLNPEWGFYVVVILAAFVLFLNVVTPETRRSAYRRTVGEFLDQSTDRIKKRVARGEVKLHISETGPKYWVEEVVAGLKLSWRMFFQAGFAVLALYLAWIYAQVVLVIVLLGALLSRDYRFRPHYVGLGVLAIAVGALVAVPLSKASVFSRARTQGPRTDSMTFQPRVTWTSHLVRRVTFMLTLPFAGLAYTLASPGPRVHYMAPIVFAGLIGFLSNLAIAECVGLVMETYDTSDLQPGANSRHRLQSMASNVVRRRTNYSSFPRVSAGVFVAQTLAFLLAAAATGVGGAMTRNLGAQKATGVTAGILLALTLLLTAVLWRFKEVKVIPDAAFGERRKSEMWGDVDEYWKPVIIGNPSGKFRRMSVLELGGLTRWTEVRKLNKLIKE